jgi:hypothetical protein
MTSVERLSRLAQPRPARRSRYGSLGDGPVCPGDASHGATYLTRDRRSYFCPHQSHDLVSRASWPNTPES